MRLPIPLCILVACLNATPMLSQTAKIFGRVRNEKGCGIGRSEVSIVQPDGKWLGTVRTNQKGHFIVENVPIGSYFLVVRNWYYGKKVVAETEFGPRDISRNVELVLPDATRRDGTPTTIPCDSLLWITGDRP